MEYQVLHFEILPSTNDYVLEEARRGAAEGLVAVADYQTRGHGRGGRKWVSRPAENLLFTILVRPPLAASLSPILTSLAAFAVRDSLKELFPEHPATIKRPNDVLMNGKKIGGILVEGSSGGRRLDFAAVGIGLNVNSRISKDVIDATSVLEETGRLSPKNKILERILSNFASEYAQLVLKGRKL